MMNDLQYVRDATRKKKEHHTEISSKYTDSCLHVYTHMGGGLAQLISRSNATCSLMWSLLLSRTVARTSTCLQQEERHHSTSTISTHSLYCIACVQGLQEEEPGGEGRRRLNSPPSILLLLLPLSPHFSLMVWYAWLPTYHLRTDWKTVITNAL